MKGGTNLANREAKKKGKNTKTITGTKGVVRETHLAYRPKETCQQ